MTFIATIERGGKTATGIPVPAEVVDGLGSSRRPAVRVTINGYTYRSTIATMRGVFLIPVSAEVRERASVAAGDEIEVRVELDTQPREISVPADLTEALAADEVASNAFAALSYSGRRRIVLSVEGARTADTRQRRLAKAVADLRGGT